MPETITEYERVCEYTLELRIQKLELTLQDVGPPGPGFGHSWSMGSIQKFMGVFTPGKSDSSLALVWTKGKKLYIVPIFSRFGSFSHHTVCSGPNQLKRTKMQSRDNIRFTCWLDVSLNAFPKLLFDWSQRACGKIPTVLRLSEVNKDRSKMQQAAHCYYGETNARVDSPHLLTTPSLSATCHAKLQTVDKHFLIL